MGKVLLKQISFEKDKITDLRSHIDNFVIKKGATDTSLCSIPPWIPGTLFPENILEKRLHLGPGFFVPIGAVSEGDIEFFRIVICLGIGEAVFGSRV